MLRTFSKLYGLAGIRLGYACGHPQLLEHLEQARSFFSVSSVAEAAALAALTDEEHVLKTLENNLNGATWLTERLGELGIRTLPTSANFVYFETEENADTVFTRLRAEGVMICSLAHWGIPTGLRVTIGTPKQNELFYQSLQKVIR